MNILVNTAYFPPIQYFSEIKNCSEILVEQHESYGKQSYRNRCDIMTANGVMTLSVPVVKGTYSLTIPPTGRNSTSRASNPPTRIRLITTIILTTFFPSSSEKKNTSSTSTRKYYASSWKTSVLTAPSRSRKIITPSPRTTTTSVTSSTPNRPAAAQNALSRPNLTTRPLPSVSHLPLISVS